MRIAWTWMLGAMYDATFQIKAAGTSLLRTILKTDENNDDLRHSIISINLLEKHREWFDMETDRLIEMLRAGDQKNKQ